jgi:asparagine synthase (glutamine-hydrolysing)
MCGFVGYLGGSATQGIEGELALLKSMADTIVHRGPDDAGYWCDVEQRVGLGHRRLSIVDLSPAGHQPMQSASGRYVIAFNGEIYNHLDLRRALEDFPSILAVPHEGRGRNSSTRVQGIKWRGHSDTETLLAGFEAWGIQKTIERVIGMFAFAVWDKQTHTLFLARDRVGEKPLYYGWQGDTFLFGSELKALRAHPAFQAEIDRGALCLLLRHNYIPAPYSIYKGIAKLQPGCLLIISPQQREPNVVIYWSGVQAAKSGIANIFTGSTVQAVDELETLLKDAVRQQMMADVPLGAFLSGGVDSSTVVALMQAQSSQPVKTFTIGFEEDGYNEAVYAKAVAQHLGTEHIELYVTAEQAMAVIPHLPTLYDEPFSDDSQIPTFLVSQLAKQHVTVSLSGDAGDELFCGYNRYQMTAGLWRKLSMLPIPLRKCMVQGITSISPQFWNQLTKALPYSARGVNVGDKLHKGANVLTSVSVDELYHRLVSHWDDPSSVVIGGLEPATLLTGDAPDMLGLDQIQKMMLQDTLTYLPDDILVKVDRAAMGVSLESRVPLLDHRVVEFAWRLPQSMKLHNGQTKWALRQVLYRHVPKELIERPKMGFAIPLDDWLRGPLRDWAESLLDESRLQREGYFHPAPIRQKWAEHLSGQRNWSYHLWDVLMFQAWLAEQ